MATKEELYQIGQAGFEAIDRFFGPPPPPRPPRNFQYSRLSPVKQQNPPKRVAERRELPPLGPYQLQYPPQELYGNWPAGRAPAAEAAAIDNIKAAQLYGGITRIDYGRFKQVNSLLSRN
ncbi:hypothetical protein CDL15_Pgr008361 [Punica granatum]|uniref:Uncharacterized protein n=1 Tax=Punica granatum TaxID=22663 RepID=A0A218WNV8_PUNGR|nr:hypothetical protein CDL15_Pgr008361 [Punica granatum]PKI48570.1 hypothetical protein CRG98_031035 [Punica granatum]